MQRNILWLASWYPNKLKPFDGDFIQRHARAVSLFQKITVIHIKKDEAGIVTKNILETVSSSGNLTEVIIFYHSLRTGYKLLDRLASSLKYTAVYRTFLKKYFKQEGAPDLVHAHVAMKAGLQALYLKKRFKISYIITEHWSGYYQKSEENVISRGWWFTYFSRRVLKNAKLILPVADYLGKAIATFETVHFEVIPNVVDTSSFYYEEKPIKKFRFLHISSMIKLKNPEGILRAAKLLYSQGSEFELLMIGSKDWQLMTLAKELGLLNTVVSFKDEMPYEQVASEIKLGSAFVLFSRYESLPCVILESLCCGVPVISSNVGGIKEVVNDLNGLLVQEGEEAQLKNAMKKMMNEYEKFDRGKIAQSAAAKFGYEVVGKKIVDIYDKLVT
ncbi:MAG: glycosyltransferase [Ginsengibacter sp.]